MKSYNLLISLKRHKMKLPFITLKRICQSLYRSSKNYGFYLNGNFYLYNNHPWSIDCERTVELGYIKPKVSFYTFGEERTLEIGNVSRHYLKFPPSHLVIDKYEKDPYVIQQDFLSFSEEIKYPFIFSISTFEHIGELEDPSGCYLPAAFKKVKSLLSWRGKAIITIPIGYREIVDNQLDNMKGGFKRYSILKRISKNNHWMQIHLKKGEKIVSLGKEEKKYPCANYLIIVEL